MHSSARFTILGLFACGLTAAYGGWSTVHFNRWGQQEKLAKLNRRLQSVPKDLEHWELEKESTLPQQHLDILECEGHLVRTYANRSTGDRVTVVVVIGPVGPTAVHDPTVCYTGSGYRVAHRERREEVAPEGAAPAIVWRTAMDAADSSRPRMDVAWTWNAGKGWQAPPSARFYFAGNPALVKVQTATAVNQLAIEAPDVTKNFLMDFLPVLDATLFRSNG